MRLYTGTSGFSYKDWKGEFYPADLPDKEMLSFYSTKLTAVEINNTFYRMPKSAVVEGWAEQVTDDFRFVIKASRRITHKGRLADVGETVEYLWSAVQHLGPNRGPILFQLPPYFKKDAERLRSFVSILPDGCRPAFEFRHESWFDDETLEILKSGNAALVVAETEEKGAPDLTPTADFGYMRLRRPDYTADDLAAWCARIGELPWEEAYVFFKHEDVGGGPRLAAELAEAFDARRA